MRSKFPGSWQALLVGAWLAASSALAEPGASQEKTLRHYVNMGSSFAAGSGISPLNPAAVARCGQSEASYARILADRLDMALDDRSCGGAKSIHLLEAWSELPAQLSAVTSETRLVTITVGGNDLNYAGNLFAASCVKDEGLTINGMEVPCFPENYVEEEVYSQLARNLVAISRKITEIAPRADVVFIQYVTMVPGQLCDSTPFSEQQARQLRDIGARLAAITRAAAEDTGAMVLDMDALSASHTPCDEQPWSIGAKLTPGNNDGMPWHPNRRANIAIADQLQSMLEKSEQAR